MPYYIDLIHDPRAKQPQIVEFTTPDGLLHFRSFPYGGQEASEFDVVFSAGFIGKYSKAPRFTKGIVTKKTVTFKATKPKPKASHYEVMIKLNKSAGHPANGYKYNVKMGTKVLDPRVIPR